MTDTPKTPKPLDDSEHLMLVHLIRLKDQANSNVADFITRILTDRGLDITYGIAMSDLRTVRLNETPVAQTPVAQTPVQPPAPTLVPST